MKPGRYSSRRLGACDSSSGSYRSFPSFAGEMAEWLKAHAWKACLLERVTWVRIPLSPPRNLDCREIRLFFLQNTQKMPVFRDYSPKTGLQRTDSSASTAVTVLVFLRKAHAQSGFD